MTTFVVSGQFDDAVEGPQPIEDSRQDCGYIDTVDPKDLEWSEEESDENEDYELDDDYDDNRVEDEDWENAERGM